MKSKFSTIFIVSLIFLFSCTPHQFKKKTPSELKRLNIIKPSVEDAIGEYEASIPFSNTKLNLVNGNKFEMNYMCDHCYPKKVYGQYRIIDDLLILECDSVLKSDLNASNEKYLKGECDSTDWRDSRLLSISNIYFFREFQNYIFLLSPGNYLFGMETLLNQKDNFKDSYIHVRDGFEIGTFILMKKVSIE